MKFDERRAETIEALLRMSVKMLPLASRINACVAMLEDSASTDLVSELYGQAYRRICHEYMADSAEKILARGMI